MKLRIVGIRDAGNFSEERVVLIAEGDGDIGRFLLASSREINENMVSSRLRAVYWIPDRQVKNGDMIVVYTRAGKNNSVENTDHSHSHFFYRGETAAVYGGENDCVVVMEIGTWVTSKSRY